MPGLRTSLCLSPTKGVFVTRQAAPFSLSFDLLALPLDHKDRPLLTIGQKKCVKMSESGIQYTMVWSVVVLVAATLAIGLATGCAEVHRTHSTAPRAMPANTTAATATWIRLSTSHFSDNHKD